MNKTHTVLLAATALTASLAWGKDIQIQENSSGLPAAATDNIARTSVSAGVKEPLVIRKSANGVSVSGSSSVSCQIKLSADASPKILGVSCTK